MTSRERAKKRKERRKALIQAKEDFQYVGLSFLRLTILFPFRVLSSIETAFEELIKQKTFWTWAVISVGLFYLLRKELVPAAAIVWPYVILTLGLVARKVLPLLIKAKDNLTSLKGMSNINNKSPKVGKNGKLY